MRILLPLLLAACAWDAPDNTNAQSAPPLDNVLSGVIAWPGGDDPEHSFVTVYDANNPGPPAGLGRPLTFATIPSSTFTTDTSGLKSATWAVGNLPDGEFLVNGLMDRDGDFSPLTGVLAGATCGDWVGTHVADLTSTNPGVITAEGGVEVDNLPVVLGAELSTERPVFQFVTDDDGNMPAVERAIGKQSGANLLLATQMRYRITPTGVDSNLTDDIAVDLGPPCQPDPSANCGVDAACSCDLATFSACDTALWMWTVDADDDGDLDLYPGETQSEAGFRDVWPRIYIEYIGEPVEVDGEVVYESGLEPGERWVSENFPLGFELTLNPDPTPYGPLDVPFPVNELSVLWSPVFRHYWEGGMAGADANGPFDYVDLRQDDVAVEDVPAGRYSVTVVSFTGQTWTLPNDLGGVPSNDAAYDNITQAGFLDVL
ncbi:MAG: hypothetical protein ACI8PZ_000442 [Myxococcota bacterium]|jgi:hypothetical protein